MRFLVKGTLKKGEQRQKFEKDVEANNKNHAVEKIYTIFGSLYKCKRHLIKIDSVEELK